MQVACDVRRRLRCPQRKSVPTITTYMQGFADTKPRQKYIQYISKHAYTTPPGAFTTSWENNRENKKSTNQKNVKRNVK